MKNRITVTAAKVNNLKSIDVEIPRNALTVITGLSGSGKSSLAFDTIYAEGQRRFMETLSSYARQFVGTMERPDVESITGLSPVVAIEQKTTNKNPRSTVGTVTEINDFLRLLFARASTAYSYVTGERMVKYSSQKIVELIASNYQGRKIAILAPVVRGRKGHYRELFESFIKKGYLYAHIDGEIEEIYPGKQLDRYKIHTIDMVIDRIKVTSDVSRLLNSCEDAMRHGKGTLLIYDYETAQSRYYSRNLMCPSSGVSYDIPAPHSFSFNSPHGACPRCKGLGTTAQLDRDKIVSDSTKSIAQGGIEIIGKKVSNINFIMLDELAQRHNFSLNDPISQLSEEVMDIIINGDNEPIKIDGKKISMIGGSHLFEWEGVAGIIEEELADSGSSKGAKWREQFIRYERCSECGGMRLKVESLNFKIGGMNIGEVAQLSISELIEWCNTIEDKMESAQRTIAHEILKEISERLGFLNDVGLGYLSLSRSSGSLSGGESQRIRLATQIGSKLINVLYILDEPSIGLHQRDNTKLIKSLCALRDVGNSVIVVEHDEEMMRAANWIVDIGPGAGQNGGQVVAQGSYKDILNSNSITADYLSGRVKIPVPESRREGNGNSIKIVGASGNNLKGIDVEIPLGRLVVVSGVSGSGKSTLINETLRPIIAKELYNTYYGEPLEYKSIEGLSNIDKMIVVDQQPIGRTPRSNPATYTNIFGDIRELFALTADAKIRGYKSGRFSFNVKGGRCEECRGAGIKTISMSFIPDVYVTCPVCNGKRYNRETLEVKYRGKSINDTLNMTIEEAYKFFDAIPKIKAKLKALMDVGLSYLTLGQPCTTISGGESQRIKLASELSKRDSGNTLFLLDEPTTGLHFEDIKLLLNTINRLVERGNTALIIEHNMDVIKCADYIIDIGPEGGKGGGQVVALGTPEEISKNRKSYTGKYLKEHIGG